MKVGVISIQGDVSEHIEAVQRAGTSTSRSVEVVGVRTIEDLEKVDGLVMPGGESTTISKLLQRWGLHDRVVERASEGFPIMGTCAGCILLAKRGQGGIEEKGVKLLGLVDIGVDRNAYGRQVDSFEATSTLKGEPVHLVFIRAPMILDVGEGVEVLVEYDEKPVMVRQGNLLALTFHPELSTDSSVHSMFLDIVEDHSHR